MNWKKLGRHLLFPPLWIIIILVILSAIALPVIFLNHLEASLIAYPLYVLAFYTVMVLSVYLGIVLPKQYRHIRQKLYENPLGNRYMTDVAFKTHVSLYLSLAVNLLYAAMNGLSYILYRSMWFVILACYYTVLAMMRFLLVRYVRNYKIGTDRLGELNRARLCSFILLTINFMLSGSVLMILFENKGFEYHGFLIYAMAAYTFYMTTRAIINVVKYRKYHSPVMSITKIITLSAALVSMLSLETAMFSQFGGDMDPEHQGLMVVLTGAAVSITVVAMSVYMIVKCAKEIKNIRSTQNGNQE